MSKSPQKTIKIKTTHSFPLPKAQTKLEELILYISKKCQSDPSFGATKLNKILYYSDFYNYANTGTAITGSEYMKLDQGPVPKKLLPTREKLKLNGSIAIQELFVAGGYKQQRVIALREPDLSAFTAQEIDIVHMVIEALENESAKEVSELSHGRAWRAASQKDTIPYESFWISDEEITLCDRDITDLMVKQGDLCPIGAP